MKKTTVNDVIDSEALKARVAEIDREADLAEYRLCVASGRRVSKALWKRMKKARRS